MITIQNLQKSFGKLPVLQRVNLELKRGECVALIGPNGCGKTTLIKSILGMVISDQGNILFNGIPIKNQYSYREMIGYMPQIGRYPDNMTIGKTIEMIQEIRGNEAPTDYDLYEAFQIQCLENKKMGTLSGGTTQKVSATLAFMFQPEVLILDEPTAGLDPLASELLKEKITKEKQKGKLILITSHLLSELDDLITEIILMQDGEIRFHEKVSELKQRTEEEKISRAIAKILKQQNS